MVRLGIFSGFQPKKLGPISPTRIPRRLLIVKSCIAWEMDFFYCLFSILFILFSKGNLNIIRHQNYVKMGVDFSPIFHDNPLTLHQSAEHRMLRLEKF